MARIKIDLKSGSIKDPEIVVGIDLGTSNSLVAVMRKGQDKPEILGDDDEFIVPSVVHFADDGKIVVGKTAREKLAERPDRTIYSVKRLLGRSYSDVSEHSRYYGYRISESATDEMLKIEIDGKYYNPIELSAFILKKLKSNAENALQTTLKKAVITVPAYFNDSQRQATRDAGKLAGWDVLRIVNEPTAASLAYGLGLSKEESRLIAVYDLGGGTFDITILNVSKGVFQVLSTNGDTYCGGDDIDRAVVEYWMDSLNFGEQTKKPEFIQHLRLLAEKAKMALSVNKIWSFELEPGLVLRLDENKLNELADPIVQRTLVCCRKALHDADIKPDVLDDVVMVGGSTRMPVVRSVVGAFFGKKKLHTELNPDEVVAIGAAIEADILAGNRTDLLLLDVTPLSLGIETVGGLMDVVIARNTTVPTKSTRNYTTSVDGQANLRIGIFQGERDIVKANRKLGEFILEGIPSMPAGIPKIEISFILDADGILQVEACEKRSNIQQVITIQPQYGLTDEEVEKRLLDGLTNAGEDKVSREQAEAVIEGLGVLNACKKVCRVSPEFFTQETLRETENLMNALEKAINQSDKDAIYKLSDRLNEYTKPVAEKIMNHAISAALKGKHV